MTAEFTGERVVPGQVDADLWNEHVARYAFASRLCRNRRVLDIGCGTGYGSADLALNAQHVTGLDISAEALSYARERFGRPNLRLLRSSASALPFASSVFDLVVGFEVIEHLPDWQAFLQESKRVLAPGGQFIVSTPNKHFYAETRRDSGPNPFHEHEFEYAEFREALLAVFPSVSLFVEDHTEGILFRAVSSRGGADVRLEGGDHNPEESNFFIAVCAMTSQTGAPTFVYVPRTANVLRERAAHIDRLTEEVRTKDAWLSTAQLDHQELLMRHREQISELEKSNQWAQELDLRLKAADDRIQQLQDELRELAAAYEARLSEAAEELARHTTGARDLEADLEKQTAELGRAVKLLDKAELTVQERTNWALDLQRERDALEVDLDKVRASRWVRLGRAFGVGPEIQNT
jgi:ubiquinone/menaquinone biosynthesis C-methylase UbiE